MKKFSFFAMAILMMLTFGCATRSDIPMVENAAVSPDRVAAVNLRAGIVLPDENMVKTKVSGSYTETIPAGKQIRSMAKKYYPYAFSSAVVVPAGSFPESVDVLISTDIQDYSYEGVQVAAGFGLKFRLNLGVKAVITDRNRMTVWETSARSVKESRAVVSPVIPVETLKAEVLSAAMAECFRKINEDISLSGELQTYASNMKRQPAPSRPQYAQQQAAVVQQVTAKVGGGGYLGVNIQAISTERQTAVARYTAMLGRTRMGLAGVEVVGVAPSSPAERAGLHVGDIIADAGGTLVSSPEAFVNFINSQAPQSKLTLYVIRDNRPSYFDVVLASAADPKAPPVQQAVAQREPEKTASETDENLPPLREDAYAVVIGIDYGGRKDIPGLKYASNDAQDVYNLLTDRRYGGIPKENTVLLLNENATRNSMVAAIRKIRTWDGYIYVYFSGHGAPITSGDKVTDAVIVPYDAVISDPDSLADTAVKISYLENMVDTSNAKGVMVALDACFTGSGKSITAKGGKPIVGMMAAPDLFRTTGSGRVIITSSAANQQSWEDDSEYRSGIFSHFFKEGLRGKAGKGVWVTINDIADYIKSNVAKTAFRLKGQEQDPQVVGSGDFTVGRNWEQYRLIDEETGRNKLKGLFEKGLINSTQLTKGLEELKKPVKSKLMDAFLKGRIDDKSFGELY
ncbi:caspase family protein [Seleniivibrio woodruffii]|uniref:caspase family protein n=1 Tax=Seleniivibrio woodruffii TaxID=1078050 RepID=UPI00240A62D7|nr:caspase family protein [Seleniivibrio woodruffii]